MKNKLLSLLIFISLIFVGCSKCGKDINLGEFKLTPQSIEEWFPYKEISEQTFKNTEGKIITLQIEAREEEMLRTAFREICWESNFDNAIEYFMGEYLYAQYHGMIDSINYSISVSLNVVGIYYNDEITDLRLKDLVTYSFDIDNDSGEWFFGGVYIYTVDYRGNAIPNENGDSGIPDFLNMVDINGNTYNDVWYFYREGAPSFYIQQGQGIIAFQGLNNEVWELQ